MPASTKASYVGRFAPPGYPNTTSTPSALRHSITASTARLRLTSFRKGQDLRGDNSNEPPGRRLGELPSLSRNRAAYAGATGGRISDSSGKSSSVPQRVQSASCSMQTCPQVGH